MNLPASTPRVSESSGRAPNRTRAAGTPMAPARRRGRDTPAPQGDTVATERQNPIAMLATAAPMRQLAPAALADQALAGGAPSGAPAAPVPQSAAGVLADGLDACAGVPVSPGATAAPQPAAGGSADGSHPGAGAPISPVATSAPQPAAGASADGSHAGAGAPISPVATSAPQPEQRRTRPANLFTAAIHPRHGATFPRLSGATSGYATVDAAVIAIRSPAGAAPRPICCRSTTCCQSPRAVARNRPTSISNAEPGVMRSCET